MKKKVNVFTTMPITALKYPFAGSAHNITLTDDEIRKCLFSKAKVEEILPDGRTVRLDFTNYNTVNTVPDSDDVKVNLIRKPVYPTNTIKDEEPKQEKKEDKKQLKKDEKQEKKK